MNNYIVWNIACGACLACGKLIKCIFGITRRQRIKNMEQQIDNLEFAVWGEYIPEHATGFFAGKIKNPTDGPTLIDGLQKQIDEMERRLKSLTKKTNKIIRGRQ